MYVELTINLNEKCLHIYDKGVSKMKHGVSMGSLYVGYKVKDSKSYVILKNFEYTLSFYKHCNISAQA